MRFCSLARRLAALEARTSTDARDAPHGCVERLASALVHLRPFLVEFKRLCEATWSERAPHEHLQPVEETAKTC